MHINALTAVPDKCKHSVMLTTCCQDCGPPPDLNQLACLAQVKEGKKHPFGNPSNHDSMTLHEKICLAKVTCCSSA